LVDVGRGTKFRILKKKYIRGIPWHSKIRNIAEFK
jgi:hypothetical protein